MNYEPLSDDEELMVRVRDQDDCRAFDLLHSRYKGRLLGFVGRFVSQEQNALELHDVVWMKVWKNRDQFVCGQTEYGGSRFAAWLFSIAANVARDDLRRGRRCPLVLDVDSPRDEGEPSSIEAMTSQEHSPDAEMLFEEFQREVRESLSELTARELLAYSLSERIGSESILGFIDAVLGCSRSAAYTLVCRAKKKLRRCLQLKGYFAVLPNSIPKGAWIVFYFEVPATQKRPTMRLALVWLAPADRDGVDPVDY